MRAGPMMNLTAIDTSIIRAPQAIIFGCDAMKRPVIVHKRVLVSILLKYSTEDSIT